MSKVTFAAVATDEVGSVRIIGQRPIDSQSKASARPLLHAGNTWLRNLGTGKAVLVIETNPRMTRYQNIDCEGEVLTAKVEDHFEVLDKMPVDAEPA